MDKKLKAKLDKVFSEYIRLRDLHADNSTFTCISCGRIKGKEQMDAGHFWNRVHTATRWDEKNVHGECRYCNRFDENHLLKYKEHLIAKIGQQEYDLMEMRKNSMSKVGDFEAKVLIKYYQDKIKEEKNRRGIC